MLTEKERLKRAVLLEETDRPPCICPGGMMNMVTREIMETVNIVWPQAHTEPQLMAGLAKASYELDCFENYGLPFCMTVEVELMGAKVDMGSLIYEPHVVGYAIDSVSQWDKLPLIDFSTGRAKVVLEAIKLLSAEKNNVPIIANLTGPVSVASSLMEPTVFYKELRRKREDAHAFMAFVSQQLLNFGKQQLLAGADMIAISDPSGTGEILGPKLFAEFVVPYVNKIVSGLRDVSPDAEVILHICGKMQNVYEQLAQVNCNTFSFDALVNMAEAKEMLKGKAVMGNVSTYTIEFGNPEKVASLTKLCLKKGVDIISPACGMGNNSPLVNLRSMLKAVKEGA